MAFDELTLTLKLQRRNTSVEDRKPFMQYYVYILKCSDDSKYVGCTKNLEERLNRHNKGNVPATSHRYPVEVITYIVFNDKYKVFEFEKYLKTGSGRAFLNKRFI